MTRSEIQALIDVIATGEPNTALEVRTVLNAIADGTGTTGDVKEIDVSNAYLSANFDVTGLGTNERLGWAICNGNNGTRNRSGRVPLQYNPSDYPTLGATGGSKDAVIGSHNHLNGVANEISTTFVYGGTTSGMPGSATFSVAEDGGAKTYQGFTSTAGESLVNKNLQPYIVTLFIQKI